MKKITAIICCAATLCSCHQQTQLTQKKVHPKKPVNATTQRRYSLKSGESLSTLFQQANLPQSLLIHLLEQKQAAPYLSHIRANTPITFIYQKRKAIQMRLPLALNKTLSINLAPPFQSQHHTTPYTTKLEKRVGLIISSYHQAAIDAGISHSLSYKLAHLFNGSINFSHLRLNNSFIIIYKQFFLNQHPTPKRIIEFAEFKLHNTNVEATRFTLPDGYIGYFEPNGQNLKPGLLRYPLRYNRISSHFSHSRLHPILKIRRPHKGTDFTAKTGTPVKAIGRGFIQFAGKQGGYGKTIIAQYGPHYRALYAHLSRFKKGLHKGEAIQQNEVIGYVGSSGLSTGPHLHYELHIDGKAVNPLTAKLPKGPNIPKKDMKPFEQKVREMEKLA